MAWYDFLYRKVQLSPTEAVLREGPARMFQGVFVFEGKLLLTERRLLFIPQKQWFWIPTLSLDLNGIHTSEERRLPTRLVVNADNRRYSFYLPGGSGRIRLYGLASKEGENWIQAIEAAQANLP